MNCNLVLIGQQEVGQNTAPEISATKFCPSCHILQKGAMQLCAGCGISFTGYTLNGLPVCRIPGCCHVVRQKTNYTYH